MNKLGLKLVCLGISFILLSGIVMIDDNKEDEQAGYESEEILKNIENIISEEKTNEKNTNIEYKKEYLGIITIPDINIELPVYKEWDYNKLKKAPTVYYGNIKDNNIVICGHSYKSHFRYLSKLKKGNKIIIRDFNNNQYIYEVKVIEVVDPYDSDTMIENEFDLTMFSCYNRGTQRIAVRAKRIN